MEIKLPLRVLDELRARISSLENGKPSVVFVRVSGNDPASISYVKKAEDGRVHWDWCGPQSF